MTAADELRSAPVAKPKHRCAEFQRIHAGFQRDIAGIGFDSPSPRWRERARLQVVSLKRRMAGQLNRHLDGCRECDR